MQILTTSVDQTLRLGSLLGRLAPPRTLLALRGHLGAGKTHLARGIALGAAIDDPDLVSSPTYVLLNIYPGPKPVYHLDAYRIASPEDFAAVGFDDLLHSDGLIVIEWPERITDLLPPDHLQITLQSQDNPNHRTLTFHPTGPISQSLTHQLLAQWQKEFRV